MATPLTLTRFDRDPDARTADGLVDRLLGSAETRIVLVDADAVLVTPDGVAVTVPATQVPAAARELQAGYLGMGDGVPLLAVLGTVRESMGAGLRVDDVAPHLPPGAQLLALEDTGHFLHIERPAEVAALALDFLAEWC